VAQQCLFASRRDRLSQGFALSAVAAAVGLALSGLAYSQEPTSDEIVVTGSRIARTTGFTTAVPVTAVTATELSTMLPGTTMADQLDKLPQFFQTQSAQRGGGALFGSAGRSALDLRSMGPQRTLVLLDGARLSPADRDGSVHIDNIPSALLSQVEVVTGGASAAYGADALAGVTNFRINRNYDGLDFALGAGETADSQGDNYNFSVAYGTDVGERGHFIGSIEDQSIDMIQYDPLELGGWFRRWGIVANPANPTGADRSIPSRLVLPDVHSRNHTPTGKVGTARNAAGAVVSTATVNGLPLVGQTFTYNGTNVRPFANGTITSPTNPSNNTANQSGGTEADIANQAFNGGPYGAEVKRRNIFAGYTLDLTDSMRFYVNLLGGQTESNDHDQRGIPHMATPWTTQIFVDNAYLPANVRAAMRAANVDNFVFEKQGTVLGQKGNWDDDEERHNQFDSWTAQLGLDKDIGETWKMQAHLQRGATRRFTTVFNEVRVDREMLAMDAVEVFADKRDANGDGIVDLIPDNLRGTGTVICNVQRYNPTPQQLQQSVAYVRVPAAQGADWLGNGDPNYPVPIPSPVGPDAIPNCTPMNAFGQGNVSDAAQAYVVSPKAGDGVVTQEYAEVLFSGDIWKGYGPGAFSMAVGATWRNQGFWQRGQPQELMAYGPPLNVDGKNPLNGLMNLGIRGIQGGFTTGSPNLHEFSTVPTIKGDYDVWELFTEFNLPVFESESHNQRLELDVAGRHSDYSTSGGIVSYKTGINFQATKFLRFRSTVSRDVREPTFAERFDLQGGGGSIIEGGTTFQITSTNMGNPNLKPEKADTTTVGIVVQPQDTGLQFSIDSYDIDLSDAVGQLGVQRIVNECNASGRTGPLCAFVFRDSTGVVTAVRNPWLNINKANVRGIDYEVVWNRETNWFKSQSENLTLRFLAGRLLEDSTTTPGGTPVDLSGELGEPDFRALLAARYQIGKWGVNLQQRYMAESGINNLTITYLQFEPGRVPGPNQFTLDDATVQSKMYTDLTVMYDGALSKGQSWQLSFAVTNLFDRDPPVIPVFDQRFSAQSNPPGFNSYDVYGRRYELTFRYKL
jgi:iron complex outermembrane recepter protein